jgi:hypothetical protein
LDNGSNTVYNGGSVGIGTASPQAKLHVSGGDILAGAPGQEWIFHTRSFAGSDFLHITDSDDGVYQFQRGLVINQSGNVGIGITAPIAGLHIKKEPIPPGGTLALDGDTHTYLTFFPKGATNGRKGYIGFASSNAFDLSIANEFPIGRIALFDSSGVNFPAAGIENLRVVRGSVAASGSSLSGGGYSVSHPVTGFYQITFSPDFNGHPVVTASADVNSSGEHRYATVSTPNFDDPIGVFIQDIPTGNLVDNKFNFIAIGGR